MSVTIRHREQRNLPATGPAAHTAPRALAARLPRSAPAPQSSRRLNNEATFYSVFGLTSPGVSAHCRISLHVVCAQCT